MKRVVSYIDIFLIFSDNSSHCKKPLDNYCQPNIYSLYIKTAYVKCNAAEVEIYVNVFKTFVTPADSL